MKAYTNGIIRNMTAEEIAELEKLAAEQPAPEYTPEERIAALEQDNAELREAMDALLLGRQHERTERARDRLYNKEVKAALQAVYNDLNKGQRKKLLRNPAIRAMFERYGVETEK